MAKKVLKGSNRSTVIQVNTPFWPQKNLDKKLFFKKKKKKSCDRSTATRDTASWHRNKRLCHQVWDYPGEVSQTSQEKQHCEPMMEFVAPGWINLVQICDSIYLEYTHFLNTQSFHQTNTVQIQITPAPLIHTPKQQLLSWSHDIALTQGFAASHWWKNKQSILLPKKKRKRWRTRCSVSSPKSHVLPESMRQQERQDKDASVHSARA